MTSKPRALLIVTGLALAATGLFATPALGTTITVTETHDDSFLNPIGDPVPPDGDCTLREAIAAANNDVAVDACPAGDGADRIVLGSGLTYMLDQNDPASEEDQNRRGDLDIGPLDPGLGIPGNLAPGPSAQPPADPFLTIEGNGSTVDGTDLLHCNVFHIIGDGVSVVINGLTIQGGGSDTHPPEGGGFLVGPGASLYLNDSVVRDNNAEEGGGIYNEGGHVELLGGTIIGPDNFADDNGGGIWTGGETTLIVQDSTVTGNDAGEHGGGIYSAFDQVTLERSTINDNTAMDGDGGGIYSSGHPQEIPGLTATNSTIVGNSAFDPPLDNSSGLGGGIYVTGNGLIELHFVTLVNNHAEHNGGNLGLGNAGSIASVDNTIIANGTVGAGAPENCSLDGSSDIESFGLNLSDLAQDSDGSALTSCRLDGGSDITGQDPLLDPLGDNGGFTETRALQAGSPAIDSAGVTCINEDQRGPGRPRDGDNNGTEVCDRGAFELRGAGGGAPGGEGPPVPPTPPLDQCTILGTPGRDLLLGTDAGETICGLGENDTIRAGGGDDDVFGNEGDDKLDGGLGNDSLTGGPGVDTGDYSSAPGSVNADLARGTAVGDGASTDELFELENLIGSRFDDELKGNSKANELVGNGGPDVLAGRDGPDLLRGKGGDDELAGQDGPDRLKGGGDEDILRGGKEDDRLGGGSQDDRLIGNLGDDTILGWQGDDRLDGKGGTDACDGGVGTNTLVNCET